MKKPKLLAGSTLRRPFIVSVSAVTVVATAACGGMTTEPTTESTPSECPETPPSSGESCAHASTPALCSYGSCYGTPTTRARCGEDGTWNVSRRSCNPPPPPEVTCPETPPTDGLPCGGVLTTSSCEYGSCYGVPTISARCGDDQTWRVREVTCNPPPPTCPDAKPVDGQPCFLATDVECGYEDCNGTPAVKATCGTDGKWSLVESSCNPPEP